MEEEDLALWLDNKVIIIEHTDNQAHMAGYDEKSPTTFPSPYPGIQVYPERRKRSFLQIRSVHIHTHRPDRTPH